MNKARQVKVKRQEELDKKPGSGKVWKHQLTVPREPRFRESSTGRNNRSHTRSSVSLSKIMSQNNLSIQNLNFNDDINYENDYCNVESYIQSK